MLRAVKLLVLFMGILIVIGIGALGYGLYAKNQKNTSSPQTPLSEGLSPVMPATTGPGPLPETSVRPSLPDSVAGFGMLFLDEPEGTEIKSMQISGSTLVLELIGGGQLRPNRLIIVDINSGSVLGRINLGSALH